MSKYVGLAALALLVVGVSVYCAFAEHPAGAAPADKQPAAQPASAPDEVATLIEQLADDKWTTRREAQDKLIEIGEPALEALRAATTDENLERAGRAKEAVEQIEENLIPDEEFRVKVADLLKSSRQADQSRQWLTQRLGRAAPFILDAMAKLAPLDPNSMHDVLTICSRASKMRELFLRAWRDGLLSDELKTRFIDERVQVLWGTFDSYRPGDGRAVVLEIIGFDNRPRPAMSGQDLPWDFLKAVWSAEMDGVAIGEGETMGSDGACLALPADTRPSKHTLKATVKFSAGDWSRTLTASAEITILAAEPKAAPVPEDTSLAAGPALEPTTQVSNIPGPASPGAPPKISGRVVDADGKPAAGVLVSAKSSSMGRYIWWAFEPQTRTDEKGRFEIPVPFDDIIYRVVAGMLGYYNRSETVKTIPADGKPVELVLHRYTQEYLIRGVVTGANGEPVGEVPIELVGEYGQRCKGQTDKQGQYELTYAGRGLGQAVMLVRFGDLAAPLEIVRIKPELTVLDLSLRKAAELTGVITERDSGRPIAGATVILRPWFANDLRMEATTDKEGRYKLSGIPAGNYHIMAVSDTHFFKPPRGGVVSLQGVAMPGGKTTTHDITMEPVARIAGKVIDRQGRPVAGAIVAAKTGWMGDYRDQYTYVLSDKDGAFSIATGHADEKLNLTAFSSAEGLARVQTQPVGAGQTSEPYVLQLSGSARIRGTVTDLHGRPVRGVKVEAASSYGISAATGADGRFDLGRVALPKRDAIVRLSFRAPRPSEDSESYISLSSLQGTRLGDLDAADPPTFYLHQTLTQKLDPDREYDFTVRLERTDLQMISGTVVSPAGEPVKDARITLYTGNADVEGWQNNIHPIMTGGLEISYVRQVAHAQTDAAGRWRILTVREGGSHPSLRGPEVDWSRYCIGVQTNLISRGVTHEILVKNVVVPEATNRVELLLKLGSGKD